MDDMTDQIVVHWEIAAKLNFACHQSSFPVLRDLRIENRNQEERLQNLRVSIRSDPAFMKTKSWTVDRIAPGGVVAVKDREIDLEGGFLSELVDSRRGTVTVTVECDGIALGEAVKPIEVLAYNEWGGAGYMPELLAAFSIPNDPAIDRILHGASRLLRKAGKLDGLDGYQSRSRQRVWEMASAIYTAIANLGIAYAVPPASFERDGQKIRLPGRIESGKIATCLDTTMLFAAAFEQIGLNPVVVLPHGHAMIGVWLQPEELSTIVIEDAETLRKRCELNELILIETTLTTSHPAPPMTYALKRAMDSLAVENDETFGAAIDIRRARAHQIKPLGLRIPGSEESVIVESESIELSMEEAPSLPDFDSEIDAELPETPDGRLDRWQRKLLDLSARNPLLNHRSTKASLSILCPDPGVLEDRLAEGAKMKIQEVPQLTVQAQDQELHTRRTGQIISKEYALEALKKNQVLVDLPADKLSRCAVDIYRKSQTSLQEGGANTLYLAIGFLSWKRDQKNDRRFRAPLILLPVALQRRSVRSGIKILAHDDEVRFNTTLLEMLRKDFEIDIKGLDGQLPKDYSGVDVRGIWNRVRLAVKDVPGFEVTEDVVLGHFSFAKYLMWKDLVDRTNALRDNSIVRHLIDTPRNIYESGIDFVCKERLDRDFSPSDLLVPLPADSSQMSAIATSDRGKDFIIIGPPGTGKSQTISNMIAHLLGKGKTVLFVSEKMAALNVVHRRLASIGLGRFCLELHSNKARKTDVLQQLSTAWSARAQRTTEAWKKEAQRLKELRDQLNNVVDYLHTRRRNGLTPYYAIGVRVRDAGLTERVAFSWHRSDQHDEIQLETMRKIVDRLRVQAGTLGLISGSPFHIVEMSEWTPQWESDLVERAAALATAAKNADRIATSLVDAIGITLPDRTMTRLEALSELAGVLRDSYRKQTVFALEPNGIDSIEALEDAIQRLHVYADAHNSLSVRYESMAWRHIDGEDILRRWQEAEATWWPKKIFRKSSIVKELRTAGAIGKPNPRRDGSILTTLRREGEAIDRLGGLLSSLKIWQGHATDPSEAEDLLSLGKRARRAIGLLSDEPQSFADILSQIRKFLIDGNDLLTPEGVVGRVAEDYLKTIDGLKTSISSFEECAGRDIREVFAESDRVLEEMQEAAEVIMERRKELHNWCAWRRRRTEAMDLDLGPLVAGIEEGRIPVEEIAETFEAAYCAWWSTRLFEEDEILRHWSKAEHSDAIAKFRAVDDAFHKLTADYIAANVSGQIPGQDATGRDHQWSLLRKLTQQKRPRVPIRKMMEDASDPISRLAPCLMMSPLSVAQYLPVGHTPFDVIIFDEASQLTVWDAVGAIARGRQVIVAGDPRQMPPSNFFMRADDDPDGDIDYEGDLESILDELRSASIPEQALNLHYRSRRESLIAFSNAHYYGNQLVTFPAPIHPDRGVRLIRSDGFYARGKARHNEGEAKAVVKEVIRRLASSDPEVRDKSIGIVTFNTEQQSLILDLLDKERGSNPQIERAFSEDAQEPVFVKNLETVQGDERDVVLFSITYGPDQSDHVTMNFGPLNRDGGERRLNVAITRARYEMVIFSTLVPDHIDLARTNAKGVKHLKYFLEYAERGPGVLGSEIHGSLGDFESPFETAVARALRDRGWDLHPQIGVSAFRIDIGIVHPDEPGVYLAGIECDGAMYHSSAYARERDKIRQSVLEGLGWTLFRVWSTDWWLNQRGALDSLETKLHEHLEKDRQRRQQESDTTDQSVEQPKIVKTLKEDIVHMAPRTTSIADEKTAPVSEIVPPRHEERFSLVREHGEDVPSEAQYVKAQLDSGQFAPNQALFYDKCYERRLTQMIEYVIDTEGPLHQDVLIRRIARHHGFQRSGRQIQNLILSLAKQRRGYTQEEVGLFFWREGTFRDRIAQVRRFGRDDETRRVQYICAEELRNIAESLGTNDVIVLARALEIARLGAVERARLETILEFDD